MYYFSFIDLRQEMIIHTGSRPVYEKSNGSDIKTENIKNADSNKIKTDLENQPEVPSKRRFLSFKITFPFLSFLSKFQFQIYFYDNLILGLSVQQLNSSLPLTPSSRISALNIVGDLLRKVGVSISFLS